MNASVIPTAQSLIYRQRASDLGRLAAAETDELKMLPLVHQALGWIQLAENEEMLAEANRTGSP